MMEQREARGSLEEVPKQERELGLVRVLERVQEEDPPGSVHLLDLFVHRVLYVASLAA